MPEGSFHSEADADKRSVHFDTEEVRNLRFRRRFGYFVAVDKVTRIGMRNIPKQTETRFFRPLPLRGKDGSKAKVKILNIASSLLWKTTPI